MWKIIYKNSIANIDADIYIISTRCIYVNFQRVMFNPKQNFRKKKKNCTARFPITNIDGNINR